MCHNGILKKNGGVGDIQLCLVGGIGHAGT